MSGEDLSLLYLAMAKDLSQVFKKDAEVAMKVCYIGLRNKDGADSSPVI